jgi:putative ABC transport system permease protein
MESIGELWRRAMGGWRRGQLDRGLDEEIRFHIDQQTEKNIRAGLSPAEARRQALLKFGGVQGLREDTRDEYRMTLFEDFLRDIRYGVRVLLRSKSFASVSILTLGLGIGAATAVFSVVDGVLLRPLPYPQPDRIVRMFQIDKAGQRRNNISEPNFEDWKSGTHGFRAMAEMASGPSPIVIGSEAMMSFGSDVSREFFDVMGVHPVVGRGFVAEEQRVGGAPAMIVSDRFWRMRLDGAPLETLHIRTDGRTYQVVGVMPAGFNYPGSSDFWLARERNPPQRSRTAHNFQVVARLADGIELGAANAELSSLSRMLKQRYGDDTWMSDAVAVPLREQLTAATRPVLLLLFSASAVLLVIACLNVSNLHLARASTRYRELALRLAVGANRGRLVRQLLAEALMLSIAAGVVGVTIAAFGVRALTALQPANLPRVADVRVDGGVLVFALGVAVVTAALLGLMTALRTSPTQLREALTEGARSSGGGKAERVRQGLVVCQVALTIVLLIGAGLLARSFIRVLDVNPGYRTDQALLLDLTWPYPTNDEGRQRQIERQQTMLSELAQLPGVERAGFISSFPIGSRFFPDGQFLEMTRPDEITSVADIAKLGDQVKARAGYAAYRIASEGYFQAMGIPLIRGRLFESGDVVDAPHVAVISESLARAKWPDQDPIGRFVQFGNMDGNLKAFRIVGVVGDVRELSPETLPGPIFYACSRQRIATQPTIVLRGPAAGTLTATARHVIKRIDPEVPLQARTVEEAFDRAVDGRRFSLLLIAAFSVCALVLATMGVYGLMAYLVAQRTREIGIRLALGAESIDVLRLIVGRGVRLALIGLVVGVAAALALTRLLEGMLFGVTATDPVAFAGVTALTLVAVSLASYIPARRALSVTPFVALRSE